MPNIKPGDHGTPNAHNRWFILFHHVWGPAWMEIHWNSNWLRARSQMTSYYTWGSVTTLHDFGGVSGRILGTFFWALTMSWSQTHSSWLICEVTLYCMSDVDSVWIPYTQCSGRLWGITGWDPIVCKTGYMLTSSRFPLLIGVYSINSSKMTGNFPGDLNFNQLFLKLDQWSERTSS